jgi:hypothetical protein
VEAFRSCGGFDNNINTPPISINILQVIEGSDHENLDGNMMCNVNLEENKHYWNSILLVWLMNLMTRPFFYGKC